MTTSSMRCLFKGFYQENRFEDLCWCILRDFMFYTYSCFLFEVFSTNVVSFFFLVSAVKGTIKSSTTSFNVSQKCVKWPSKQNRNEERYWCPVRGTTVQICFMRNKYLEMFWVKNTFADSTTMYKKWNCTMKTYPIIPHNSWSVYGTQPFNFRGKKCLWRR